MNKALNSSRVIYLIPKLNSSWNCPLTCHELVFKHNGAQICNLRPGIMHQRRPSGSVISPLSRARRMPCRCPAPALSTHNDALKACCLNKDRCAASPRDMAPFLELRPSSLFVFCLFRSLEELFQFKNVTS